MPELVHAAEAADTETLCGESVTDDTLVAIQDWRGHVTCGSCRIEAEL